MILGGSVLLKQQSRKKKKNQTLNNSGQIPSVCIFFCLLTRGRNQAFGKKKREKANRGSCHWPELIGLPEIIRLLVIQGPRVLIQTELPPPQHCGAGPWQGYVETEELMCWRGAVSQPPALEQTSISWSIASLQTNCVWKMKRRGKLLVVLICSRAVFRRLNVHLLVSSEFSSSEHTSMKRLENILSLCCSILGLYCPLGTMQAGMQGWLQKPPFATPEMKCNAQPISWLKCAPKIWEERSNQVFLLLLSKTLF